MLARARRPAMHALEHGQQQIVGLAQLALEAPHEAVEVGDRRGAAGQRGIGQLLLHRRHLDGMDFGGAGAKAAGLSFRRCTGHDSRHREHGA